MAKEPDPEKDDKKTYDVLAFASRDPSDQQSFAWDKHLSVGDAARIAADHFGIVGGQPTLAKDGTALDRSKQLVAAGVRDGDVLEVIDAAGGV